MAKRIIEFDRAKRSLACADVVEDLAPKEQAIVMKMLRMLQGDMDKGLDAQGRRRGLLAVARKIQEFRAARMGR